MLPTAPGKQVKGYYCTSSHPFLNGKAPGSLLPQIVVTVNGKKVRALVDTGCTTTLVWASVIEYWEGASNVRAVDGREVRCCGETFAKIVVRNIPQQFRVIVLEKLVTGIDVILGLDVIDRLGGAKGQVRLEDRTQLEW